MSENPYGPDSYTVEEVAKKLRISLECTFEALRLGDIPSIRVDNGFVIPRPMFESFIREVARTRFGPLAARRLPSASIE